jgi:hypothetical protein
MGLLDIFRKPAGAGPGGKPQQPRRHHYNFAYKALPGLAFADPHVPLAFTSSTFSWPDLVASLEAGGPFGREVANHKLAQFWADAGEKLASHERIADSGLSAIGGEFGPDHVIVLVRMPEPLNETEAYFVALIYPKSWFDKPGAYENSMPDIHCYLLAKSAIPTIGATPAGTLRVVKKAGHGAVSLGVPISTPAFLNEVLNSLQKPERWITWVDSPTWNFFMRSPDNSQMHGAA